MLLAIISGLTSEILNKQPTGSAVSEEESEALTRTFEGSQNPADFVG
jgi:hypothetical protein